jgi:3-oxoacyl-[acyl-carrier-protein] synthase I
VTAAPSHPMGLKALGLATPLGSGKQTVADALFEGTRAGLVIRDDLIPDSEIHVGAVPDALPPIPETLAEYDCRNNRLMLAALMEIAGDIDAVKDRLGAHRIAIVLGTSTSGIAESEAAFAQYQKSGTWPASYDFKMHEAGGLAEFAARWLGTSGPAFCVTTACSSSAKVFASARRLIDSGICDAAVVGGADSLCQMTLNGFGALEALSRGLCNPFSANRDGINIGEGAAAFLMTPEPGPVTLLGVGETSDAHHISAPDPEGTGAIAAMAQALDDAGLTPDTIAYINAHGTGTALNDVMEARAIASMFPPGTPCSSTKAMTGHMLGAAGACEAAFLWLTLNPEFNPGLLPPHLWDGAADPDLPPVNLVPTGMAEPLTETTAMLSNSFAFGGSNASLVLGR